MTCRELIEFLMAYLDHELPPGQQAAFEAHLDECSECVDYLDRYKETVSLGKLAFSGLDVAADEQVPKELIAAIRSARERNL